MQTRSTLALLSALALSACATLAPPAPVTEAPPPPGPHLGEYECAAFHGETVTIPPDAPLPFVVRANACAARLARPAEASDRWIVRRHLEYDEHATSALVVAAMIETCVADGSCDPLKDPESFAYVHAYAAGLALPEVESALKQSFPSSVAMVFYARLKDSIGALAERAKSLDVRRRTLFVDLPLRVRADRLAYAKTLARFQPKAADLVLEADTTLLSIPSKDRLQELIRSAKALRDEALLACSEERPLTDCFGAPVVRPLTDRLVQLAIRLGDAPQAAAEYENLRAGPDHSTFAVHLGAELGRAFAEHQATVGRYEEEKKAGRLDEVLMLAAFGSPPPERLPELQWKSAAAPETYAGQIKALANTERIEGIVKGSRGRGGALEIAFDDGRPVLIDVAEARLLRIGEKLSAMVEKDSRRGVVLYAYRTRPTERVVQFRGTRLGR